MLSDNMFGLYKPDVTFQNKYNYLLIIDKIDMSRYIVSFLHTLQGTIVGMITQHAIVCPVFAANKQVVK